MLNTKNNNDWRVGAAEFFAYPDSSRNRMAYIRLQRRLTFCFVCLFLRYSLSVLESDNNESTVIKQNTERAPLGPIFSENVHEVCRAVGNFITSSLYPS